ncbi:cell adhesion molecule 2 [Trichonephila inaurata madagascariensis]|uniref:Cell adhesion molecule 2 n=1 Tax=Trichonephila inaurata madagascariensis TaxID=2747483 RepID=A0A8X6Y7S6_9ARAC|nr:cell adhesion molecule 2 [Trichonephila inaurata madagascariensis]
MQQHLLWQCQSVCVVEGEWAKMFNKIVNATEREVVEVNLKKTAEDIIETTIACPDVVPPNNTVYVSPDGESLCELAKDKNTLRTKDNYRNCVVALKRSWSFKKGHQEKADVEVTLTDLNNSITKHMDTSSTTFLGDVTLEENLSSKKIVIKVEQPPDQSMKTVLLLLDTNLEGIGP